MKKILTGMLIAISTMGMVFAQGAGETASSGMTPKKTVLKLAVQADSTPATQSVIDAFNASQDTYTVQWVDMTNDSNAMREQLLTSLKSGSSDYDVLSMDVVWAGEFAASGYIEPLDVRMKNDGLKVSQFNAGSMASGSYNAKQYVLPFFPDLGVLFFRSDIVSTSDAEKLRSGNYTWQDLADMAAMYQGQGGTKDGFAFEAKLGEGLICTANEFTSNWKDLSGGLAIMKQLADSSVTPADTLNYAGGDVNNNFIKGNSVFSRNWPYQFGQIKVNGTISQDQVDIAPLPGGSTVGGWILGINAQSKHKDGAWQLIKFIATEKGQKLMSTNGGYLPGYNATLTDPEVLAANLLLSKEGFKNALKHTIARPVTPTYSKVSDEIQQSIHKYLSGSASLDDTVKAVQGDLAE